MDRINGAGHIAHLFVAEDSAINRPPTEITAEWLNGVQEELIAVITGASLVPAAGDVTQLRQAIAKMIQAGQRAVVISGVAFAPAVVGTGKTVYWDAANNRFDLAQADGTAKQACVGFADVPNGNVYAFGDAVLFAGLTPGARYYLDAATAGALTTVAPANVVPVGIARSATEIFVDIDAQAAASSSGIQGNFRNLTGSSTGMSALVTYAVGELTTGDGAGNFQTLRTWAGTITMTTLGTNGLDVGAVAASTWYYAYAISKADGTKAFIASLSAISPSFANAAGYTKWARIGAFRTDGTGNKYPLAFKQFGRRANYVVAAGTNVTQALTMISGVQGNIGTPTWVAAAVGNFVPPTASRIQCGLAVMVGAIIAIAAPNNGYGAYTSTTNPPLFAFSSGSGSATATMLGDLTLESANVYYASNGAASLFCYGWEDNL